MSRQSSARLYLYNNRFPVSVRTLWALNWQPCNVLTISGCEDSAQSKVKTCFCAVVSQRFPIPPVCTYIAVEREKCTWTRSQWPFFTCVSCRVERSFCFSNNPDSAQWRLSKLISRFVTKKVFSCHLNKNHLLSHSRSVWYGMLLCFCKQWTLRSMNFVKEEAKK